MTDTTDTDDSTDRDRRIEQLVAIVEAQQQQIEALAEAAGIEDTDGLLSRRNLLQAGATTGAAGLLVAGTSGSAAAAGLNDGDTQWGSTSNRDDYVVDHLDAKSVDINGNELYIQGAAPSSPSTGDIWIDNDG